MVRGEQMVRGGSEGGSRWLSRIFIRVWSMSVLHSCGNVYLHMIDGL